MISKLARFIGKIWLGKYQLSQAKYGIKLAKSGKEDLCKWIEEHNVETDTLLWIIETLRLQKNFSLVQELFPYLKEVNDNNQIHYLRLVNLARKVDFGKDISTNIYKVIKNVSSLLNVRTIANVMRSLEYLELPTIQKFEIIDIFSGVLINNLDSLNSFDRSYIINGICTYPCTSSLEIFKAFAEDTAEKSIYQCSSLCNFICIQPYVGYDSVFEYTENLILTNDSGIENVFAQIIHSFSKLGKGSKKLINYFILKSFELQDKFDNETIGVIISSLYKFHDVDQEMSSKVDDILVRQRSRINSKHLSEITRQLNLRIARRG